MLDGEVSVARGRALEGDVSWSDPAAGGASAGTLRSSVLDRDSVSRVMLSSGRPVAERIVVGGPFVMGTEAEIAEAYRDFRSCMFGQIPRPARLRGP